MSDSNKPPQPPKQPDQKAPEPEKKAPASQDAPVQASSVQQAPVAKSSKPPLPDFMKKIEGIGDSMETASENAAAYADSKINRSAPSFSAVREVAEIKDTLAEILERMKKANI